MEYEPECTDGLLVLTNGEDELIVGNVDEVIAAIGTDTYTVKYQHNIWGTSKENRKYEVDVYDALQKLPHPPEAIDELRKYDMKCTRYGLPTRTVMFARMFVDILEREYDYQN